MQDDSRVFRAVERCSLLINALTIHIQNLDRGLKTGNLARAVVHHFDRILRLFHWMCSGSDPFLQP